jgi:hypothetical protein
MHGCPPSASGVRSALGSASEGASHLLIDWPADTAGSREYAFSRASADGACFWRWARRLGPQDENRRLSADVLPVFEETFYSTGGGFIRRSGDPIEVGVTAPRSMAKALAREPLALCDTHGLDFCDVARANEESIHGTENLGAIWEVMHGCVDAGLHVEGTLPGGLGVKRMSAAVCLWLEESDRHQDPGHDTATRWLHAFARAVNEENASGG